VGWSNTRSEIAARRRHHPDADLTDLKRQLAAETLENHIRKIVAKAPPLSDRQRNHLASIILDGGDRDGG
jgi:hypothetical protein